MYFLRHLLQIPITTKIINSAFSQQNKYPVGKNDEKIMANFNQPIRIARTPGPAMRLETL